MISSLLRRARGDEMITNSAMILLTTFMLAGGGALFWVIAARLASPSDVGLAGSLVVAGDSLALFAQLGLNVAILRTLPVSSNRSSDIVVSSIAVSAAGAAFALVYALLLPVTSPRLSPVVDSPVTIALFCLLVGATALNVLTDSIFLGVNRVLDYVRLNGVLLNVVKLALPFALAGAGAIGLYGSVGTSVLVCAVASIWMILRHVPGSRRPTPSAELRASRGFAAAGYLSYVLTVLPLLSFPLIVINARGAAAGATYFICFQVVGLIHALVLAVANSAYAQCERARTNRHAVARKATVTLIGVALAGALAMQVLAPYFLRIFGEHYVSSGTTTLRIFAVAALGAAFNYAGAIRLRLAARLPAMVLVQLVSTAVMMTVALQFAHRGIVWIAIAWGAGHAVGGVLGFAVTATVARFKDDAPTLVDPEPQPAGDAG